MAPKVQIVETDAGRQIDSLLLAEPLSPSAARDLAYRLDALAPKAEGRKRMTLRLPLLDGTSILVEGWWPISEEAFEQMLELLRVMRPGLVDVEGLFINDNPPEA